MDGLFHGKSYEQMDDLGVKTTIIFGLTPIWGWWFFGAPIERVSPLAHLVLPCQAKFLSLRPDSWSCGVVGPTKPAGSLVFTWPNGLKKTGGEVLFFGRGEKLAMKVVLMFFFYLGRFFQWFPCFLISVSHSTQQKPMGQGPFLS